MELIKCYNYNPSMAKNDPEHRSYVGIITSLGITLYIQYNIYIKETKKKNSPRKLFQTEFSQSNQK